MKETIRVIKEPIRECSQQPQAGLPDLQSPQSSKSQPERGIYTLPRAVEAKAEAYFEDGDADGPEDGDNVYADIKPRAVPPPRRNVFGRNLVSERSGSERRRSVRNESVRSESVRSEPEQGIFVRDGGDVYSPARRRPKFRVLARLQNQLIVCALILLGLVAVRNIGGSVYNTVKSQLNADMGTITGQMSLEQVGKTLEDAAAQVFNPTPVQAVIPENSDEWDAEASIETISGSVTVTDGGELEEEEADDGTDDIDGIGWEDADYPREFEFTSPGTDTGVDSAGAKPSGELAGGEGDGALISLDVFASGKAGINGVYTFEAEPEPEPETKPEPEPGAESESEPRRDANGDVIPNTVRLDKVECPFEFSLPVGGWVSSPFGMRDHPIDGHRNFHHGVDIASPSGSDIKAAAAGKVAEQGYSSVFGNYVLIEHENGFASFYAHCKKVSVSVGDKVKKGGKIATVGSTGLSTGPHLHFEIRYEGVRLNPEYYVTVK